MSFIQYTLATLVAISLLVAIHEYGHYLVARLCGIKVLRFSIGFGQPLISRRFGKDQTEYCISALPLGGYVKMLDEREGTVSAADRSRSFQAQPIWQRIAVLLAGPAFNFLFVIAAFWLLFLIGIPIQKAVVGDVTAESPAATAGLETGDTIVAVAGRDVEGWEKAFIAIVGDMVGDATVTLSVLAADGETERQLTMRVPDDVARLEEPGAVLGSLGFRPSRTPAVLARVAKDGPAYAGGLRDGDRIVAVDGEPIDYFEDLDGVIKSLDEPRALSVDFMRDGTSQTVAVTPAPLPGREGLFLNVGAKSIVAIKRLGPLAALPAATRRMVDETAFTLRMLGQMLTGNVSLNNLSGPVSIAQFAGQAADRGLPEYVRFLAIISISLGILNLLPVPMLDGGQIVYQSIEWAKGSPLSERAQIIGQQLGIVMLLSVMLFATYNDIARLFGT